MDDVNEVLCPSQLRFCWSSSIKSSLNPARRNHQLMKTRFNLNPTPSLVAWAAMVCLLSSCASSVNLANEGFQESADPKALVESSTKGLAQNAYSLATSGTQGLQNLSASSEQHLAWNLATDQEWWKSFNSTALNQLVEQALLHNPNLTAAQSTLAQAKENAQATYGSLAFPNVNAQVGVNRERASQATTNIPGGSIFNLYNTSVNVSYTLDLFGANQFTIAQAQAQAQYQTYQWRAAELSLTGNVITAAIRYAQLNEQIKETKNILAAQEKQLQIMENQLQLGAINKASVLTQSSLVAQTRSTLPSLYKSLEQSQHQIAILCGDFPAQSTFRGVTIKDLNIPKELPISLPSELVRKRPDILASEALMNQSIAALGVAKANLYPQVNLSANAGSLATLSNNLFSTPWSFWTLSTGLTAPIFNAGALNAKVKAARAGYEASFYGYKSTVLGAFQNVADSLAALEYDTQSYLQQSQNVQLTKDNLAIAQRQYELGAINFMVLLDAQRNYAQAQIGLINAQANRLANTVALYQSMGGGAASSPMSLSLAKPPSIAQIQ